MRPEPPVIRLFDEVSSTCTYIVHDAATREAAIIDPVLSQIERDLAVLQAHALNLRWSVETHTHADHVTGTGMLARRLGATSAAPAQCGVPLAPHQVLDGDRLPVGGLALCALHTPGHTLGSTCYLLAWEGGTCVFTGDTLLIDGCGRTDFQQGSAEALYDSVQARLFTLPDDTVVFPGHDYRGRGRSTVGHERRHNARLAGRTRAEFVALMRQLDLPRPKIMDVALPANRNLGLDTGAEGERMNTIDEQALRDAAAQWEAAWNRHDMSALHELFTDDADLVTVSGLHWKGRDTIRREHAKLHEMQFRDSVWTNGEVTLRSLAADVAVAHIPWALRGDRNADGTPGPARRALFTWVLVRTGSTWRIAAAHNTNRAA